uniref:Uncharacterized protein n=1 Tax=Anopheles quadriannulatus TaxID=34691 RepID=A0A182XTN0_ANOQN
MSFVFLIIVLCFSFSNLTANATAQLTFSRDLYGGFKYFFSLNLILFTMFN